MGESAHFGNQKSEQSSVIGQAHKNLRNVKALCTNLFESMRLYLPISLLALVLCGGCEETPASRGKREAEERRRVLPDYRVVTVEGCEYLRFEVTHGFATLTHKGNCRNSIHAYQDTTKREMAHPVR